MMRAAPAGRRYIVQPKEPENEAWSMTGWALPLPSFAGHGRHHG